MCLSTVYNGSQDENNVLAKNIALIECNDDSIILTDLMERKTEIKGSLLKADLAEGYVIVRVA